MTWAVKPTLTPFKNPITASTRWGTTPGSATGVAMFMALVSLMCDRAIRSETAMTGEISLRGLVLPVGGIKEKVVAAASAGLLPARNRRDYEETRNQLEFIQLERVEEAIAATTGLHLCPRCRGSYAPILPALRA
jgi:ATP-dependent Lon protease